MNTLKNTLFTLITICLFCSVNAKTEFKKTINYSEVFQRIDELGEAHGKENVLVVFDIDDTLLVIDHCQRPDGSWTTGIGKFYHCASEHTEKILSPGIRKLQDQGYPTMALTARGASLLGVTQRELAREHPGNFPISFDSLPFENEFESVKIPRTKRCRKNEAPPCLSGKFSSSAKFSEGVLYSQGAHKGLALNAILDKLKASFPVIVFIDDKSKNTDDVIEQYKKETSIFTSVFLYLRHRD